jgi:hypothetical protein
LNLAKYGCAGSPGFAPILGHRALVAPKKTHQIQVHSIELTEALAELPIPLDSIAGLAHASGFEVGEAAAA